MHFKQFEATLLSVYAVGSDPVDHLIAGGCSGNVLIPNIPFGTNRIITAIAYDINRQELAGTTIKAAFHVSNEPTTTFISPRATPVAKIIEWLMNHKPALAVTIDLEQLSQLVDQVLGVSGTFPEFSYTLFPAQLNFERLSQYILDNAGQLPELTSEFQTLLAAPTTSVEIQLATPNGRTFAETVMVQIDDPLSNSDLISFSTPSPASANISNIPPGHWKVIVKGPENTIFKTADLHINWAGQIVSLESMPWTLQVREGSPLLTKISPSGEVFPGVEVTLTGNNFNGLNSVEFTGGGDFGIDDISSRIQAHSFTVVDNHTVKAVVPRHAQSGEIHMDGVPVDTPPSIFPYLPIKTNGLPVFVNEAATNVDEGEKGRNWLDAYTSLEEALEVADGKPIWIAKGTYSPSQNDSFVLTFFTSIYGGFNGNESQLNQRNIGNHTILTNSGTDSVIKCDGGLENAVRLNHLVISGGNGTNGGGAYFTRMGGLTLENLIFKNNSATNSGGGLYIRSNGGFDLAQFENGPGSQHNFTIKNVVFENNQANQGGGLYVESTHFHSTLIANSIFYNNSAGEYGSGLYLVSGPEIGFTFSNNMVIDNHVQSTSSSGGALTFLEMEQEERGFGPVSLKSYRIANGSPAQWMFANSLFWGNRGGSSHAQIASSINYSGGMGISYNVLENNPTGGISGLTTFGDSATPTQSNNINVLSGVNLPTPENHPVGPDGIWGTEDDTLKPISESNLINAGNNSYRGGIPYDILGTPRVQGFIVDIGPYEYFEEIDF